MAELKDVYKEALLKNGEVFFKATLEEVYAPSIAELEEKLKDLIPGESYDMIATLVVQSIAPALKSILLAQVEKVHEPVA